MSEAPAARSLASWYRTADAPLELGARVGAWTIAGKLGAGGMATVYAAVDDAGTRAAIKLAHRTLIGDGDGDVPAATFLREARVAAAVDHPGVVAVHGTGMHDGLPYVALELLRGTTLGERLAAGAPLPRPTACELVLELVGVLRAAGTAGITHRDLKPDNIFLVAPRGGRRVKLLDWGVAHVAGEPDPFAGMIAGTLTYVAPEQIRGDALTPAADVYSLGVLAYRLLCSRAPFAATSDLQLVKLHLRAPPPRVRFAWPEIPARLDALIAAMLAKDPADRPGLDEIAHVVRAAMLELHPPRWAPLVLGLARVGSFFTALA